MSDAPHPEQGESTPYALWVHLSAKEGKGAELAALMTTVGTSVRAEPGNVQFVVHTDRSRPDDVYVYETYQDLAAYEAHQEALQRNENLGQLGDLLAGNYVVTFLKETA